MVTGEVAKVSVMLAGAGGEIVFKAMQPPLLQDERFAIRAMATCFEDLEHTISAMRPEALILHAEIAPGPDPLVQILGKMQVWNGVAVVVIRPAWREFMGVLEAVATVRGVYIEPVNWGEIAKAAYNAALTERAKVASAAPLQHAYLTRAGGAITGTRVIAFLSACSGAGRSTVAENLGYELAVRGGVKTLLASFDQPPAAVPHLRLRYQPSAQEYFDAPRGGLGPCLQDREGLAVVVAPEDSAAYLKAGSQSEKDMNAAGSVYGLVMTTWSHNYAAVLLDLPGDEGAWTLHPLAAANTVVIVARPTLADMAAARHTLLLLLERLADRHRVPREAIHLVLNQVSEKSSMTAHAWHQDLAATVPWAPPIAAAIPFDPAVTTAQDRQVPPVTCVDAFSRGIRQLATTLFPGVGGAMQKPRPRTVFRLPGIRVRVSGE
jgi:MinD-like ATPase involved in chromosome partitioning or flagellar assembly